MAERRWITDADADARDYLIRIDDADGCCRGWQAGRLDLILDLLSEGDYADAIGEDSDRVSVFVLWDVVPVPCRVDRKACPDIGMIETTVSFRTPGMRGKAAVQSETGYTRIMDF